jgi:hypothetical protein
VLHNNGHVTPHNEHSAHSKWWGLILTCSVLNLTCEVAVHSAPWTGILDPVRANDWTQAGAGPIPARATICKVLGTPGQVPTFVQSVTAAQINSAIAGCNANETVLLETGTYNGLGGIDFAGHNNVTLRGRGASNTLLNFSGGGIRCNGLGAHVCMIPSGTTDWNQDSPGTIANWTAGYTQGATQITLSSVSGLAAGRLLVVDRLDETTDPGGDVWLCSAPNCIEQNTDVGRGTGVNEHGQSEIHTVVSVAGNVVTITPGLLYPNWSSAHSPQAWWAGSAPATGMGIEDLSLNYSNSTAQYGMQIQMGNKCWVKGIRSIKAKNAHVNLYLSTNITIRDSYFYGSLNAASQSYGFEPWMGGNHLWENNIFQHQTSPMVLSGASGIVAAYNYAFDDYYCPNGVCSGWFQAAMYHHESGSSEILWEGNNVPGLNGDGIHGPGVFTTVFRNRIDGKDPLNSDNKTAQTVPITLSARYRFFNIIGNVLGTSGYHSTYQDNATVTGVQSGSNCDKSIYRFGWAANCSNTSEDVGLILGDPTVDDVLMRWGNYDTVTNGIKWNALEVPTGLAKYSNAVPASQTLPASFYLTEQPGWWTTPWGTPPWPAVGPDVTGGNIANVGGHAYKIPAQLCYEHLSADPAFAAGTVRTFDASSCYSSGGSECDLNNDSITNVSDVQLSVNQAVGAAACSAGDINKDGSCNVVDVQRVVNAALGGQCVTQ